MGSVNKNYVSEIDRKLAEFDRTHQPSAAQQVEIDKYQRIYQLRDQVRKLPLFGEDPGKDQPIWQDF